jgi:hypothetical protein
VIDCWRLQVLALVWAGSQVTKVFRYAGAVLLAPVAARLLDWTQARLGLQTRGRAVKVGERGGREMAHWTWRAIFP